MLKKQDDQLDETHGIVQGTKLEAQNFDQEVTYQNRMLQRVSKDIDRNQSKMDKAN